MNDSPYSVTVQLPGGYRRDGRRYQEAAVRPVNGHDEVFLRRAREALCPAELTTALLGRCVQRLGPCAEVSRDMVRSLTVGDREALLLHLRRLSFGEAMSCLVTCPVADCAEKLDIPVRVSDLLLDPYGEFPETHEKLLESGNDPCRVRFRLPTGRDQEQIAATTSDDPRAAAYLLLERCIETVETESQQTLSAEEMSPGMRQELSRCMANLDPQAQVELQITCPECGHEFSALLDAGTFLVRELAGLGDVLDREVHLIALCYHWSRAEIMALPSPDRRCYVDILQEALAEEAPA